VSVLLFVGVPAALLIAALYWMAGANEQESRMFWKIYRSDK
jgi:hypothetical protein